MCAKIKTVERIAFTTLCGNRFSIKLAWKVTKLFYVKLVSLFRVIDFM